MEAKGRPPKNYVGYVEEDGTINAVPFTCQEDLDRCHSAESQVEVMAPFYAKDDDDACAYIEGLSSYLTRLRQLAEETDDGQEA